MMMILSPISTKKMKKQILSFAIITATLVLTGCSREPSQEQLQTLYQEKIQQTNALAERLTQQEGELMKVSKFEKLDCHKIDKSKDLSCRINVTVEMPFLGAQNNTTDLRVTKSENGWVIVD